MTNLSLKSSAFSYIKLTVGKNLTNGQNESVGTLGMDGYTVGIQRGSLQFKA